jgi:signal transduction histidine kinase
MRRSALILWPAGAALGIAAEWIYYGWGDPGDWVPDLLTGWTLIACGLVAWSRRADSGAGPLMTAAGCAWFIPNFQGTGLGAVDWLAAHALYLHRGPLVQLVLTYPTGRPAGKITLGAIAVGYAAAVITPVWRSETTTIVLAALLAAAAVYGYRATAGPGRRGSLLGLQAALGLAAVLAGNAIVRLAAPARTDEATLLAYETALCCGAAALLVGLLRVGRGRAVTDLVVELSETRSGTLRDALARELGDPSLELGFWLPERGCYVDADGRRVELPKGRSARAVTRVERDGQPQAVLVHDDAALDDPTLVDAVAAAARLATANARLQAEVRARVAELRASRRRLLEARDEERRRLEQRLREGAERRLASLQRTLEGAGGQGVPATAARFERAGTQLRATLVELRELAAGLHPRELSERGLAGALTWVAEQSPVPVDVDIAVDGLPIEVEAAVYFVCSEALANIAKYASASNVAVSVAGTAEKLTVEVADDGVGGADAAAGTGLRGLADRIEALGGTLSIESPAGRGTRLVAEIPLEPR